MQSSVMKTPPFQFTTASMLLAISFIAFILAAYCRGAYLLGQGAGLTYAVVASLITVLFCRTLYRSPLPKLRLVVLVLFTIPVSLAFAFPTYVNPDVQHFVNKETTDRNARRELATLFASDSAFRELGVSTTHLKVVNVEIYGAVPTKSDLERLRSTVLGQCKFVDHCFVHWRVHVRENSTTYTALGDDAFDAAPG
jgi:hypothetical protein